MEEYLLRYLRDYQNQAIIISIILNIVIAILGLVPSFFITAANIVFFGFWNGTFISFLGEVLGAVFSFLIYRKGFKKVSQPLVQKHPKVSKLVNSNGREAFYLVLLFRLMPLVPSGLVTFAAAIGKISVLTFVFASSLGKIPALLIEAFSAAQFIKIDWLRSWLLELSLVFFIYWLWRRAKG